MSFADEFKSRYDDVIKPAIESIRWRDVPLTALRVDISKSGDSIITDIMDGIAHSAMVLADVSTAGRDAASGKPYRNGNVMYEVGIALACRLPTDVLLVRDDNDPFLFDVSTIPHLRMNFHEQNACEKLANTLVERLRQQTYEMDARVKIAIGKLSLADVAQLKDMYSKQHNMSQPHYYIRVTGAGPLGDVMLRHLFDLGLARAFGAGSDGSIALKLTPIGMEVGKQLTDSALEWEAISEPTQVVDGSEPR